MKIITARQQGEAIIRLANLNDALMSDDVIKRMDAMEHTAELAYIIGGLDLMNMIKDESFGAAVQRHQRTGTAASERGELDDKNTAEDKVL